MASIVARSRGGKERLLAQGRLWTLEEVAAYLRVSVASLRRWTNAGTIACYRIGGNGERRFSREQVQAFLAAHERRGHNA